MMDFIELTFSSINNLKFSCLFKISILMVVLIYYTRICLKYPMECHIAHNNVIITPPSKITLCEHIQTIAEDS
jgi:hypothetical protein